MLRKYFSLLLSLCLALTVFTVEASSVNAMSLRSNALAMPALTLEQANNALSSSSSFFTENKGQWTEEILFIGNTDFGKVAFTNEAIYYQLIKDETVASQSIQQTQTIKLSFVDAESPTVKGKTLLPHYNNYFIGNDQDNWGIHCNNYTKVSYTNVWDNIDLSYFFTPEGMKYEYYVHPGADIQDLQVQVIGADLISEEQSLELFTPLGNLKDDNLLVFTQETKQTIQSSFLVKNDTFSFDLENTSTIDETIVIDPIVYSTYLGGNEVDNGYAIAIDNSGNAYIAGETYSHNFPMNQTIGGLPAPGYDKTYNGEHGDVIVVKLNPSGTQLLYSTYLGGMEGDYGRDIALDTNGNVYVTGWTDSFDFPMNQTIGGLPAPGYDKTFNYGSCDGFVFKLNPSGTELLYSTFLGGNDWEVTQAISVDANGNAYVTGWTCSFNFPMDQIVGVSPAPGYDKTFNGGFCDAFVVKLNPSGTELMYSTYIGGNDWDVGNDVSVDANGNAYVTGYTGSLNFPMTRTVGVAPIPGYDQSHNGDRDGFIIKLNPSGTELLYSTFLGGNGWDSVQAISVDANGNAYVTGETFSIDFPMDKTIGGPPAPGYDQTINGNYDAFVVKLNPSGSELLYSTYIGGNSVDIGYAIDIDNLECVYISGHTESIDFPMNQTIGGPKAPGYDQTFNGNYDAFVVKLNPSGTHLLYSTFLGGNDNDYGKGIVADNSGNVFITGITYCYNFPMTQTVGGQQAPGYDKTFNGIEDAFVVKLYLSCPELYVEGTTDKGSYRFQEIISLDITIRNFGGMATGSKLDIKLPRELSYASCDDYAVISNGQNLSLTIGTIDPNEIITFVIKFEATTDVKIQKNVPILLELNANECATYTKRIIPIVLDPSLCPELYVESTPNKSSYYFHEVMYLNITIRNLGAEATGSKLDIKLPRELSYASCDDYAVISNGQNLSLTIGTIDPNEVIKFVMLFEVTTDVQVKKSAPIILELKANECDSYAKRVINILLEPKRTGRQDLDLSLKLLNLEFDDETGKYYLLFEQTLEMSLTVSGYQNNYSCDIKWGDGETTNLKKETESSIIQKHRFTARGTMNIKITVKDVNGRIKTSTILVNVK